MLMGLQAAKEIPWRLFERQVYILGLLQLPPTFLADLLPKPLLPPTLEQSPPV